MRRTLRQLRLRVSGARYGRPVVPAAFLDPERGRVVCAAAPLLAAELSAEVTADLDGSGMADGELLAVSYLDRTGTAGGFGLVVHRDDGASMAVAEQAMARWSGVLRSRRLLVSDAASPCWGARRAIHLIKEAARVAPGQVAVIGRPVIGSGDRMELAAAGVVFADDLDQVPGGARVVLPAHGAGVGVRAAAAARGLRVLDATCPLVAMAHADAAAYAARGDVVVVIGRDADAALPVLAGQAGAAAVVTRTPADVDALQGLAEDRISFVIDTGMPVQEAMPVLAALRRRFPKLTGHHFDVLCEASSDVAQSVASVAASSELTLAITGPGGEAESRDVVRWAGHAGAPVLELTRLADLTSERLTGITALGLVVTTAAPAGMAELVVRVLSGLGPLSVRRRDVHTSRESLPGERPRALSQAVARRPTEV